MLKYKSAIVLLGILGTFTFSFHVYANTNDKNNNETTSQYMEGTSITTTIKAKLLADPDISSFDISVTTEKGVVTLTGEVDTQEQIDKAEAIVKKVEGVRSVDNQLKLRTQKNT